MLKMLFVAAGCIFFTSCLEINEQVEIKPNGSGELTTSMDMGQLIDMMQAMGGEEFEKNKNEKIDSTIFLKNVVDTASNLTSQQKDLMRDGKMHVKMNMEEKEFKITMKYPFNNMERLQQLNSAISDGGMGLGDLMKGAMGGGKQQPGLDQPANKEEKNELDQLMGIFDYNVSNGLIKKTVNAERLQKLKENPKMAEMQQGSEMGIEILYNVTYKLPRPAKKVDNSKAKLSDDKMTVTLRNNLMEIFTRPEQFAFTIEY